MKKTTKLFQLQSVLLFSAVIFSFLFLSGCQQSSETQKFRLGFIPSEKAEELTPKAEELAVHLEQHMGMEVEITIPTSYEVLIEALRFGHLDASFMDSGPAYIAHQKAGAEVVLAELKNGSPFYFAEVYVRADSDISELSEILGKKIAFTSWTGSSGFIFPIGTLVKNGLITPEGGDFVALQKALDIAFEQYIVAGGYKQALDLLIEGKVDVAAGAHDAREKYLEEGDREKIKSLVRLGQVPSHPVMVSSQISEDTKNAFVEAMLQLNAEDKVFILENLYGVDGIVEANTQDHLGDFGPIFESLTGIRDHVFDKR